MLYREMLTLCFMEVPKNHIHYWADRKPFGDAVASKFPDAAYDLEQASKCMALDRHTACVFHLMRVLDQALHEFAAHLNLTIAEDPKKNWKPILEAVDGKISEMPDKTAAEIKEKEQYQRLYGHLNAVKDAWRNPTMHPRKQYDPEEAEDVFCATRSFMRDLAKALP
jgi:hypothetical protein